MFKKQTIIPVKDVIILLVIWLLVFIGDRIWFSLDQEIPRGDQGFYLNNLMDYWQWFQPADFGLEKWWDRWYLLSQNPPLLYISTLPILKFLGESFGIVTLILSFYNGILIFSVYGLGRLIFSSGKIGIGGAFLIQVIPLLYYYRLAYTTDYPSTALITCSFFFLTLFYFRIKEELNDFQNSSNNELVNYQKSFNDYCYFIQETVKNQEKNQNTIIKYSLYSLNHFSKIKLYSEDKSFNLGEFIKKINLWIIESIKDSNFKYSIILGLSLGCSFLMSQTSFNFLLIPLIFIFFRFVFSQGKKIKHLFHFFISIIISLLMFIPWYKSHWLILLFLDKKSTIAPNIADSSPLLNIWNSWFYYLVNLPFILSWIIFLTPFLILLIYFYKKPNLINLEYIKIFFSNYKYQWLILLFLGSYLLWSFKPYQEAINILPLLPLISLIIIAIVEQYKGKFKLNLQRNIGGLTVIIMLLNLFPLPGGIIAKTLSPYFQSYPSGEQSWQYQELFEVITSKSPYLKNPVGFIHETAQINGDNFSFYGRQNNLKISGHSIQSGSDNITIESQPLDWLLAKTEKDNNFDSATTKLLNDVKNSYQFTLERQWLLSDNNNLQLFHRHQPLVEVQRITQPRSKVKLDYISHPLKAPPGFPIPISYEWSGKWQELEDGMVLLTWIHTSEINNVSLIPPVEKNWLNDHKIGLNRLNSAQFFTDQKEESYRIIEHTAMLPSPGLALGDYQLVGIYINQKTGDSYPLAIPNAILKIELNSDILESPETDFISQIRSQNMSLSKGTQQLDSLLNTLIKIRQFDPMMPEINQLQFALNYRLDSLKNSENQSLNFPQESVKKQYSQWLYSLALTQALQNDIKEAIATGEKIITMEDNNPYSYIYLAFIYLYNWQPNKAEKVLQSAIKINPDLPEIKAVKGLLSLMKGNLLGAWQELNSLDFVFEEGESL
jgi:4-amino-4-deoxy-L-arabinose transferase-like glycosyltransferase